jgi:protein TonB
VDRPTILVIDYEPRNLAATVEPLTQAGYNVEIARDGLSGLDAFRRLQPPIVFMEAMLPKKHAFEVCQEIRRSQPGRKTRVFILGAPTIAQSQQLKAVHQYGADRFLPRPVDGPTLVSLCSPLLPGPNAPPVPEVDLMEPGLEQDLLQTLAPPQAPRERLELSAMSEDDIMAQLDLLLPSVKPAPVQAKPEPAPAPVTLPPVAKPQAKAKPAAVPIVKPASAVRPVTPAPVPVQLPPPERRPAHAVEGAPAPAPARSRIPMVLAGCVVAGAAFGSWILFRPGTAPVSDPVQAVPFATEAPLESALPQAPPVEAPSPLEAQAAPAEPVPVPTPRVALATPPPTPVEKPAPRPNAASTAAPPPAPAKVEVASPPQPVPAEPAAAEPVVAAAEKAADVPLPIAPPRLEPLPVGSDAARPRISPEVFIQRVRWGSFVELRDVDKAPVPVSRPAPTYPPGARQMRREGEVELRLLIDARGEVAAVERLTGGKSDLSAAAERAVRRWRYQPAMKDGVQVQTKIVEKIAFKL